EKAGAVFFVGDLADEYGFTDLDGAQPHFTRSVRQQLEQELAATGELSAWARRHAASQYMNLHLDPAAGDAARRLATRLGWARLGQGLQPIETRPNDPARAPASSQAL
ncbi:MAG TPA: hypothetical protein VHS81_07290, partial [Caulobacteraceae bacterium]|nr:hypothetical protein [Caulobacteraceae bacterium]